MKVRFFGFMPKIRQFQRMSRLHEFNQPDLNDGLMDRFRVLGTAGIRLSRTAVVRFAAGRKAE
jgi:hypothetical protein